MSLQPHPSESNSQASLGRPDGRAQLAAADAIGSGVIAGAMRDAAVRATAAAGVSAIAVIHAVDSVGKWTETRYIFWLYMLLVAGCIVTVAALLFARSRAALLAAAGLAATVIVFYAIDRIVGLPNATSDIGNWVEPLGLASLVVEGFVVVIGLGGVLAAGRRA
jgi:hypothetical protein